VFASQGPDNKPVALEIHDCGACLYCLDKPRFGGKGTKRQKCVNKKMAHVGPIKAWASLRVTSTQELQMVENFSNREPPTELTDAVEQNGPLPLVWAFPRARRARPLPPAYVLMYYCEKRVPLDRRYLFRSLEFRANPTKRSLDKVANDFKGSSMLSLPYAEEEAGTPSKLQALQSMPVGSPASTQASGEPLAAPVAPAATSGPPPSLIEINTAMAEASMAVGKARAAAVLTGGASAEPARNANSSRAKPVPVAMDGLCIGTPLVTLAMTEAIHASNQSLQARLAASQGKPLPAKPKPRKPRPPSTNVPEAAIRGEDDKSKGASKGAEQQHKFMWTFDANCGRLPTSEEVQDGRHHGLQPDGRPDGRHHGRRHGRPDRRHHGRRHGRHFWHAAHVHPDQLAHAPRAQSQCGARCPRA
jgi:CXXC zinc finger domain